MKKFFTTQNNWRICLLGIVGHIRAKVHEVHHRHCLRFPMYGRALARLDVRNASVPAEATTLPVAFSSAMPFKSPGFTRSVSEDSIRSREMTPKRI